MPFFGLLSLLYFILWFVVVVVFYLAGKIVLVNTTIFKNLGDV
jgi:hypothetical protein